MPDALYNTPRLSSFFLRFVIDLVFRVAGLVSSLFTAVLCFVTEVKYIKRFYFISHMIRCVFIVTIYINSVKVQEKHLELEIEAFGKSFEKLLVTQICLLD